MGQTGRGSARDSGSWVGNSVDHISRVDDVVHLVDVGFDRHTTAASARLAPLIQPKGVVVPSGEVDQVLTIFGRRDVLDEVVWLVFEQARMTCERCLALAYDDTTRATFLFARAGRKGQRTVAKP